MTPILADALALALAAQAVEAQRVEDVRPAVDVRSYLSPAQQQVYDCKATTVAVNAGRRGGKTVEASCELIGPALEHANSLCVYLSLTAKSARRIMWPVLKATLRALNLDDVRINEHTMEVTFPNGSIIILAGTDDLRTIESWRGAKLRVAVIDEAGSQPGFLEYLAWDILEPALADLRGRLMLIGTPAPRMQGFWFDMTNQNSAMRVPVFRWTMRDNPHFPDPDGYLAGVLEKRGWTTDHPTYRREYLAEWCDDPEGLCFPFDQRNFIEALPTHTPTGILLPVDKWRRGLSADVGIVDACAFAELATHPMLTDDYVVRVTKQHMGVEEFRHHMRRLIAEVKPFRRPRVDTGGMGKAFADDCIRRGVAVEPAKKLEKEANIRLFRDRARAGRIKIVAPDCYPLLDEAAVLTWNEDRDMWIDDVEDHAMDATLYGWRDLHNYRETEVEPVDDSPAARARREEEAWIAARLKAAGRTSHIDRSRAAYARR